MVFYTFFTNNTCFVFNDTAATETLTLGLHDALPISEGPLAAGSYAFQATYSGDANYGGSTSGCEPFSVGAGTSGTATTVFDAATNVAWAGTESTGSSAYDTASVSTSNGFVATGTVTYTFFTNNTCAVPGNRAGTGARTVIEAMPNSGTEGPLAAGSYAFQATYSGDANYGGSTSRCEPFSVGKPATQTATTVFDAATNAAWSGTESTGASAYDTATVSGQQDGIVPTGMVTYTF